MTLIAALIAFGGLFVDDFFLLDEDVLSWKTRHNNDRSKNEELMPKMGKYCKRQELKQSLETSRVTEKMVKDPGRGRTIADRAPEASKGVVEGRKQEA